MMGVGRRVTQVPGATITHEPSRVPYGPYGLYDMYNSIWPESATRWYEAEWRRLVRRLQYPGGRKARRVKARILRHWRAPAWEIAVAEARGEQELAVDVQH